MKVLSAERSIVTTVLPACRASVIVKSASVDTTGALKAFSSSPIVTFLFIGVPEGSSTTWTKSSLAEAVPNDVNAVIFLSAILVILHLI